MFTTCRALRGLSQIVLVCPIFHYAWSLAGRHPPDGCGLVSDGLRNRPSLYLKVGGRTTRAGTWTRRGKSLEAVCSARDVSAAADTFTLAGLDLEEISRVWLQTAERDPMGISRAVLRSAPSLFCGMLVHTELVRTEVNDGAGWAVGGPGDDGCGVLHGFHVRAIDHGHHGSGIRLTRCRSGLHHGPRRERGEECECRKCLLHLLPS